MSQGRLEVTQSDPSSDEDDVEEADEANGKATAEGAQEETLSDSTSTAIQAKLLGK